MLSYRLLRNHAGMLLMGDYESLVQLHEIVHDVNERSPLIEDEDGAFLGLAYDVRKAYEQQRESIPPPNEYEESGARVGGSAVRCCAHVDEVGHPDRKPRRSFDLREYCLFEQLATEDTKALGILVPKTPNP